MKMLEKNDLQEFELNNDSMKKIHGGSNIVQTYGWYFSEIDAWCNSDSGDSDTNSVIAGYDCCALDDDGTCR